jgi:hypothetical protein
MTVIYNPRQSGTYVMGSQSPITFTRAELRATFDTPRARADLRSAPDAHARTTVKWMKNIPGNIWLTDNQVNAYTGPGPVMTDDHPLIEYFLLGGGWGVETEHVWPLVLRLALVVTGLLVLLIIGTAIDSATRRRTWSVT